MANDVAKETQAALTLVKTLLSINDDSKDNILNYWLGSARNLIFNYCNFTESDSMPEGLYNVWAEIASLKYQMNSTKAGSFGGVDSDGKGPVASVTDGSQSVSYGSTGSGSAIKGGMSVNDDDLLTGYKVQLNRYRRLRW